MSFDTPVLLLAWRRPDATRQVIDAIRRAAPTRVFVACDGPRSGRPDDVVAVRACRDLIDGAIDWHCTVERRYQETHQGCRRGVSGALDWFFTQVDEGIVLEDDCVPHDDFLPYCAALLERYRDDVRVWCVSGNGYQDGHRRGDGSYFFSRYNHVWGWASWRRAWQHYDVTLQHWPTFRDAGLVANVFEDPVEARYWSEIWDRLHERGEPDTWDYQWTFACLSNGGLTTLPNGNLVRNIGFDESASHTRHADFYGDLSVTGILPLVHPSRVRRDPEADAYTFDHHFHGAELRLRVSSYARWLHRLRTAIRDPLHYPRKAWRRMMGGSA